jgi:hypothetical protein
MIVNQTAAAYTLAMRLSGRANSWARRSEEDFRLGNTDQAQMQNTEAARLASSAGKLMLAVSSSALALEKLRHGTRQSITVRHLTVTRGGQAVVAGVVRK